MTPLEEVIKLLRLGMCRGDKLAECDLCTRKLELIAMLEKLPSAVELLKTHLDEAGWTLDTGDAFATVSALLGR